MFESCRTVGVDVRVHQNRIHFSDRDASIRSQFKQEPEQVGGLLL